MTSGTHVSLRLPGATPALPAVRAFRLRRLKLLHLLGGKSGTKPRLCGPWASDDGILAEAWLQT